MPAARWNRRLENRRDNAMQPETLSSSGLIAHLGEARRELVASFQGLDTPALNRADDDGRRSIAQIICHLQASEMETAALVRDALAQNSPAVPERDLATIARDVCAMGASLAPLGTALAESELIQRLEESRFKYLQSLFNETHVQTLAGKSLDHPRFGPISLSNLLDTIWLHERQHSREIAVLRSTL